MAYESLTWPAEPSSTDLVDAGETYNMGIKFSLAAAKNCLGVRWRVPDSVSTPPGGTHVVSIWRNSDTTRLAFKDFVPTVGGYQEIFFDTPIALSSGVFYVAAVHTQHYVFRNAAGLFPVSSPSGNVVGDEGRLVSNTNSNTYPAAAFTALYYVSPLIETTAGGVSPDSVNAPVTLGAPSIGQGGQASPNSLNIPLFLGAPTVLGPPPIPPEPGPVGGSGGWRTLINILREAGENVREDEQGPPSACPNDGEPLLDGPDGKLYCPFDGYRPR